MKLSIIIPVLNERDTISVIISRVSETDIGRVEKEIIVVDDGSNDGTEKILQDLSGIIFLRHLHNKGKGTAIRTAMEVATGEIILIQDADLEYDPGDYSALIAPILKEQAEVVYGSRRLKRSNRKHSGFLFYLGGISLTFLTNVLFPGSSLTDEATGYKVFRRDFLQELNLSSRRFEFCPEVTAKVLKRGVKIYEVPISYVPRSTSAGKKIRFRDGVIAAWTLLRYRLLD